MVNLSEHLLSFLKSSGRIKKETHAVSKRIILSKQKWINLSERYSGESQSLIKQGINADSIKNCISKQLNSQGFETRFLKSVRRSPPFLRKE